MRLPSLDGVPRVVLLVGVPIAVFIAAIGLGFGTDEAEKTGTAAPAPTVGVFVQSLPAATTSPAPTAEPATPVPDRADCAAIRGTSYLSDSERDWYQSNCIVAASASPVTVTRAPALVTAAPVATGGLRGSGDRLVIPRLNINAPVNYRSVGPDGQLGDPAGAFDVVWYDFTGHSGLGGYPGIGGNSVIAGHVDYRTVGQAVFFNLRQVAEGDVINYHRSDGVVVAYSVVWFSDVAPNSNWNSILASDGKDSITLITCNGEFNFATREYSHRRVVRAVKVS